MDLPAVDNRNVMKQEMMTMKRKRGRGGLRVVNEGLPWLSRAVYALD